jgi:hypothetical protein
VLVLFGKKNNQKLYIHSILFFAINREKNEQFFARFRILYSFSEKKQIRRGKRRGYSRKNGGGTRCRALLYRAFSDIILLSESGSVIVMIEEEHLVKIETKKAEMKTVFASSGRLDIRRRGQSRFS